MLKIKMLLKFAFISLLLSITNAYSATCTGSTINIALGESCNYTYNDIVTSPNDNGVTSTSTISISNAGSLGSGSFGIYNNVVTGPDNLNVNITANISTIANSGSIGSGSFGIYNNAVSGPDNLNTTMTASIGLILNSGSIIGTSYGIYNNAVAGPFNLNTAITAHIETITNTGTIGNGTFGIYNTGSIANINNLQGASTTALKLYGNLPTNYNIIINSPSNYGKLAITNGMGSFAFGIYNTSIVAAGTYSSVISGTNNITITSGTFGGLNWALVNSSGTIWDLVFSSPGPNLADTQSSLHSLAPKIRSYYTTQSIATNFANMNTYDCNLFDAKGLCVSVGGQQTYVDSPSANMTSAVVVAGYKVSPTLRIGGFLNQNVNSNTGSNVDISNNSPLMGLFAVWNQNENHLGYQVKIANAYQDMDVTTTRDVIGTSEAGTGKTSLNTQSYVGELSYAFLANEDKTLVRPYAALRYTRIKQDGYTEDSSVTTPLTYAALEDRSTAALVGVKLDHKLADNFHVKGSLGIEQDIYHHVDNLTATGVANLTSENFNDNIKRTRPVASIGAYFSPAKNQRIAADLYYQQLSFQSTGSATAYVNYMIGF